VNLFILPFDLNIRPNCIIEGKKVQP